MPRLTLHSVRVNLFSRVANTRSVAIVCSLLICCSLMLSSLVVVKSSPASPQATSRRGRPQAGPPATRMPNLDLAQRERLRRPETRAPRPSSIRSHRKPLAPRNGRKVGDPGTTSAPGTARQTFAGARALHDYRAVTPNANSSASFTHLQKNQRNHARSASLTAPPINDLDYVQWWFSYAVERSAEEDESLYWGDILRRAHAQGQPSMVLAAREMGKTLFESREYSSRDRSDSDFVYDLYKTYLLRSPDNEGWEFWQSQVPEWGRDNVRRAFDECGEFIAKVATVTLTGVPTGRESSLLTARLDPKNQPGNQMMARDAEWSAPLLSLPGRAGLDLNLGISYSSAAVWTPSGPYIYFDEDNSPVSPGFNLGFPTVQDRFFNAKLGQNAYLLITPAGNRVQLLQVGTSNIYEAADSSYMQLTDLSGSNPSNLLVRPRDGTQMTYTRIENAWRCTEIKDRNGNYITVNYNEFGDISTVIDTLARVVTFNYDSRNNLSSITQTWNGAEHVWASFSYDRMNVQTGFYCSSNTSEFQTKDGSNGRCVIGLSDEVVILTEVGLDDGSHYNFEYERTGQINTIRRFTSDELERSTLVFNYREEVRNDYPRIVTMSMAADNWTGINDVPSEVLTEFGATGDGACRMVAPDGTIFKEYYGTGRQQGLVTSTMTYANADQESSDNRLKWTTTNWTQDNTSLGYPQNPRSTETNIYDANGHRRRTTIGYTSPFTLPGGATCSLPSDVYEYDTDASTVLRRTHTDYNLDSAYINSSRRIIGLTSATYLCDGSQGVAPCSNNSGSALLSKATFHYDETGSVQFQGAPVQHDETNFGSQFVQGRGNPSSTRRYDVNNPTQYVSLSSVYNTTGSLISSTDAAGHQSSQSYTDSFSADGVNDTSLSFITLAYPTTVTDAGGFSSVVKYHYDFGSKTRVQGPPPANQSQGLIQVVAYDNAARIARVTTTNNGAYQRFWYGSDYTASFSTVNNVADEAYSIQTFDGLGRAVGSATNNPASTGGYKAKLTIYDSMGRVAKESNPTEINGGWVPAGDDSAGWLYTQNTYDWKGRPLVTTNPDNTSNTATYDSCGCAGSDVVTVTDEGTLVDPIHNITKKSQQKIYHDVLGRPWKQELLNWQGGSPYATTVTTYNARDQVTLQREFDGAGPATPGDASCSSASAQRFGSDTSWKQSLTESTGWQNPNFDDSSWSAAVDEGAYGTAPWGTAAGMPAGTSAHWIWYYDSRNGNDQSTVYFRKTFTATTTSAKLRITGDNLYFVYLNGNKVADSVGTWDQPSTVPLALVQGSTNTIAVIVFNFGGPGGLLADIDSGSACQQTTMSYDGHGRLQSRHAPEQSAGTATTWDYYLDDTVQKITDARSASSTYTYNSRHMVTGVTFNAPAGITIPTAESYSYDAAGNRSAMSDGSGSLLYQYDPLSRLTSETKYFNGLAGSYTAGYAYNLAGDLKTLTYNNGSTITYGIDADGRTTSVTGSAYGGVTDYVSNITYRASDQPKGIAFGNGTLLEMSYTSRLQLLRYNMRSYVYQGQRYDTHKVDHQYNPNGSLLYAHDITYERFDRAYNYDQVGRLAAAYTGAEARAFVNQPSSSEWGPYRQYYQFNAWGDMIGRINQFWSQSDIFSANFANGRNQDSAWQHDANGNIRFDRDLEYKYDASGINSSVRTLGDNITTTQTVDGDGELIKRQSSQSSPLFYFRSSALDGKILAEINAATQTLRSYVYLEAEVLAVRENNTVYWRHENPMTGSRGETVAQGFYSQKAEPDSMGVDVGFQDPWDIPPETFPDPDLASLYPGETGGQCRVGGVVIHCHAAQQLLASGSAARCPNDDCSARWNGKEWKFPTYTWKGFSYSGLSGEDDVQKPKQTRPVLRKRGQTRPRRVGDVRRQRRATRKGKQHPEGPLPQESGGENQTGAPQQTDVCDLLARNAQKIYDELPNKAINLGRELEAVDARLSKWYVGRRMSSFATAAIFYVQLLAHGGDIAKMGAELADKGYFGTGGFPEKFLDSRIPDQDQTHHFVAFLSAGINDTTVDLHVSWDFLQGNGGDLRLGFAAYHLGQYLRNNRSELKNIGNLIQDNICRGRSSWFIPVYH
ncbi:MAG: hypothetical protein JWM21_1399 [Acidobacteria bacterium]|nr:hypothetical protein [Acidobacteriota bacterium]